MVDGCGDPVTGYLDCRQRLHRLRAVAAGTAFGRRAVGTVGVSVARLPVTVMAMTVLISAGHHFGGAMVGARSGRGCNRRESDQHGQQQGDQSLQCAAIPFAIIR